MENNFPYSRFFSPHKASNHGPIIKSEEAFGSHNHRHRSINARDISLRLSQSINNQLSSEELESKIISITNNSELLEVSFLDNSLKAYSNEILNVLEFLSLLPKEKIHLLWPSTKKNTAINLNSELQNESHGLNGTVKKTNNAKDHIFSLDLSPTREDLENKIESKFLTHLDTKTQNRLFLDPNKTFDNFIVGPSNNMAYATALAVGKNPGKAYPCLYLYSKSGLGKTHLLHAIGNAIKDSNPHLKICLTTAREFMNEVVEATKNKRLNEFPQEYSDSTDVLMVDDVHELNNKEATQNIFFHVFNEIHKKGKQLIFTSDKEPREIEGLEERLKTRLSWGLVLDIQPPDLETRIAILKQKAFKEDIVIPDDVVTLVASSIKNNIRELEGSLIKLAAYSSVFQVPIDSHIAREQLKLDEYNEPKVINLELVLKAVSQYFKITQSDLKSKSRSKDLALARHIAMYISYKIVNSTYSEIGIFYGGRDHSTVMHAVEKIKEQIKVDHHLSIKISEIEELL